MSNKRALQKRGNPSKQTESDLATSSLEPDVRLVQASRLHVQKVSSFLIAMAQQAATRVAAKACCIYILDKKRQELIPCADWRVENENTTATFAPKAVGEGVAGLAIQSSLDPSTAAISSQGGFVRVDNLKTDPRVTSADSDLPYQSALAMPLTLIDDEPVGVLLLADKIDSPHFLPEDEQTLTIFAEQSGIALAIENINLHRETERSAQALTTVTHMLAQTDQQLQKRVDELVGLQRVSHELNSTFDLDKVLGLILTEAVRVARADFGSVNLYRPELRSFVARQQQDDIYLAESQAERDEPSAGGFIEQVIQTGQAILVADLQETESYGSQTGGARSRIVVPIQYGGEPAGIIHLESKRPNFFNDDQLHYLEALSNQAAVAIGNAQVYQEQKREREQASRRADQLARLSEISDAFRTNRPLHQVLEDVAYAIVESVGYEVVLISLVRGAPPLLRHEVGAGIPIAQFEALRLAGDDVQPLSNLQAAMKGEFQLSNSYFIPADQKELWQNNLKLPYIEKQRISQPAGFIQAQESFWQSGDLLFTPLTDTENNIIGLLTVQDPDNRRRPELATVETLEIFANQAAVAIENSRLFDLEQQRRRLADTLRGVAEAISSQLEFEELLNFVLQALRKVVDYDSASVQLLQEDRLVIIGGHGWEDDSQQIIGLSFPLEGDNPNRLVIETQEPVIVKDGPKEYPASFVQPHDHIRSWLGVPLTYGTNVLGIMTLDSVQPDFFTEEDAEVILAFANQVAVALQNARLFDEARHQVRQLAALTDVAQALNHALDLNEVLNLVLDGVFDLLGSDKGSIWLIDDSTHTVKMANTKNVSDLLVELFNESAISVDSEPFASVIKSGQVSTVMGNAETKQDDISGLNPYPGDVTYVPLKTEKGVIGILAIEDTIHNANLLQLVNTLADLAAVAIDSARLLEDIRRQASEMQHLYNLGVEVSGMLDVHQVMRSVIRNGLNLTGAQIGTILLWDEENEQYLIDGAAAAGNAAGLILNELEGMSAITPGSEEGTVALWCDLARRVMDIGRPLIVIPPDQSLGEIDRLPAANYIKRPLPLGVRTILGVPIQVKNQASGAIFVSSQTLKNFRGHDVQLLSFVANQAAVAASNARLVQRLNLFNEELERRVEQRTEELARTLQDLTEERDRVGTLYQITRELAASFDLDRMLTEALSLLNRAIGISQGAILLPDLDTGYLVCRAAWGRDRPLPRGGHQTPYKMGVGLAGKVMEERQPRLVSDLANDPDWIPDPDGGTERRSAIAAPLISGEEVVGALLLFYPESDYFTEDQLKLVTAAGAQVATAINNAELYRLITNQAERLGVMLRTQAAEAAKNQAILEGITDGVLVLDARRNVLLVNPKAAEILDIDPRAIENQPIRQILGRSKSPVELQLAQQFYDEMVKALAELDAGKASAEFRIEVGNKAVAVTIAPVALGTEDSPSIVSVLRDISREAEIERIKNEFISTVSHELRTPMTSIKGYADLLVSGNDRVGELNSTQQRFVQVIQSNANRLTDLVNDILEISRIETGRVKLEFETLNIIKIIKDVSLSFEGHRVKKSIQLSLDLPDELPNVYADRARLTQVLVNLIGNAWQYTPEGGNITVKARLASDNFVQIDVQDTGIGILEQDIPYIFDRFFRSERPEVQVVDGTGLGLSITRMFVEMQGGEIWVESEQDVGTTFSFTAPLKASLVIQQDSSGDTLQLPDEPHILMISDDPVVGRMLQPHLEAKGVHLATAHNPADAVRIARTAAGVLKLIVLDILLTTGDAFTLLEHLREDERTAGIPVLVTSLIATESEQTLTVNVIDYVATCFVEAQVLETVRSALASEIGQTARDAVKNGRGRRILIVDSNRETVEWLKDALDASGYEVQRAFNSRQALDMATSSKPDLILAEAKMIDANQEMIIAQLSRAPESQNIPIVIITDTVAPTPESNQVTVLGKNNRSLTGHPIAVNALATELVKMSSKADAISASASIEVEM